MERIIGGEQEGFLLSIRDDGNYLTVYPTDGDGGHVELSTLKQQLKNAGITNYDELQVGYSSFGGSGRRTADSIYD